MFFYRFNLDDFSAILQEDCFNYLNEAHISDAISFIDIDAHQEATEEVNTPSDASPSTTSDEEKHQNGAKPLI